MYVRVALTICMYQVYTCMYCKKFMFSITTEVIMTDFYILSYFPHQNCTEWYVRKQLHTYV